MLVFLDGERAFTVLKKVDMNLFPKALLNLRCRNKKRLLTSIAPPEPEQEEEYIQEEI